MTTAGVGTNRFSYSFNDPVNLGDPNGNIAPAVIGGLAALGVAIFSPDTANAPALGDETYQSEGLGNAKDILDPGLGDVCDIATADTAGQAATAAAGLAAGPLGDLFGLGRRASRAHVHKIRQSQYSTVATRSGRNPKKSRTVDR